MIMVIMTDDDMYNDDNSDHNDNDDIPVWK